MMMMMMNAILNVLVQGKHIPNGHENVGANGKEI